MDKRITRYKVNGEWQTKRPDDFSMVEGFETEEIMTLEQVKEKCPFHNFDNNDGFVIKNSN